MGQPRTLRHGRQGPLGDERPGDGDTEPFCRRRRGGGVPWAASPGAFAMGWHAGGMAAGRARGEKILLPVDDAPARWRKQTCEEIMGRRRGFYWKEVELYLQNLMDFYCGDVRGEGLLRRGLERLRMLRRRRCGLRTLTSSPGRSMSCRYSTMRSSCFGPRSNGGRHGCPSISGAGIAPSRTTSTGSCFWRGERRARASGSESYPLRGSSEEAERVRRPFSAGRKAR